MSIRLDTFENSDFDRGASRWKELAWHLVKWPLFEIPLPLPSGWRVAALRAFGAEIGEEVVIRSGVRVTFPWRLVIGDHVWIGDGAHLLSLAEITIGSHVCLSQRVFLCSGSHEFGDSKFPLRTAPIRIGDHCWVGAAGFVGLGVEIGQGSQLAAATVLMKSCPSGSYVRGNPAQVGPNRHGVSADESGDDSKD